MTSFQSFKNQLLVAMPTLNGSEFSQSVTLICEHNREGAMGIVVNHPLELSTPDLLEHMNIPCEIAVKNTPVLAGGPVQTDRGFVIHRSKDSWKSSIHLNHDIAITTSSDVLHAIGRKEMPSDTYIALGYAGWGPGQLEQEILQNSWFNIPLNAEILFDTDISARWSSAANALGFDINQLSYFSGNA